MTVEDILDDENVELAIEYLMTKKNACGDDGVWLHGLAEYWEWNKNTITEQIQEKKYYPQLIHNQMIVTGVGKHRIVSHMSSIDRLLVRAILQVLRLVPRSIFLQYLCGFASC